MKAQTRPSLRDYDRDEARNDRVTQAYLELRDLITWGRLAPGARIIETDVAARLGVSRTPVRSALQRLQQEGYIVSAGAGLQSRLSVAPLTREDSEELFAIVAEVEGLAAVWAARRPDEERRETAARLRRINSEIAATIRAERPDHYRVFELDQAFHLCYVEAGAGPRLRAIHAAVKPQTERYVRLYISALLDEIGTSVRDHATAVDAIEAGDAEAAKAAVLANWRHAADRLVDVIGRLGERGAW